MDIPGLDHPDSRPANHLVVSRRLNRGLVVLTCVLLATSWLGAQTGDLALTASTGISSRYVHRGVVRSATAWQAALDGSIKGWRGRFWSSNPFDSAEPGELQSSLGYVWSASKSVSVEMSGTHFWYVDQPIKGATAHSFEANVKAIWTSESGWRWGIDCGYDIRLRSRVVEGSVAYDLPLKTWGTYLEGRVRAGHLAARDLLPDTVLPGVRDAYTYFEADMRLPYRFISTGVVVALDVQFATTRNQNRYWSPLLKGSGNRGWIGLSASMDL